MQELFSTFSHAIEGAPHIAIGATFVWGILSVLLSPCHLASIPLIVGYIDKQGNIPTKRAFAISLLFSLGILITIGIIGAVTASAGRIMGNLGPWANYFVAVIFFAVGLNLLEIIPSPWSAPGNVKTRFKGLLAALFLGLVFGIALGPCTFAYMAPVLGVVFTSEFYYGVALIAAYGLGHCSIIVAAGTSTELVQHYLNWTEKSRGAIILKKICGVLVLVGGLYLLYTAP